MTTLMQYAPCIVEEWLEQNPWSRQYDHDLSDKADLIRAPDFLPVFYDLVTTNPTRPPSETELLNAYLERNNTELKNLGDMQFAVIERLKRNYPSFIMELHFCCMINTCKVFDGVFNDLHLDMVHGIDFVAWKKKPRYVGVKLGYVSGPSQGKWIPIKEIRVKNRQCNNPHPIPLELIEGLMLPLRNSEAERIGNMHLYTPLHIEIVKQKMMDLQYWD